jgi:hypothetical protein
VNFFSQNHCPGKVIYWPATAISAVPMEIREFGYPILSVTLDGHPIKALFDTGSTDTFLDLEAAKAIFGITPGSPDMVNLEGSGLDDPNVHYRRTFKSLDLNGIAIANIPIVLIHNRAAEAARKGIPEPTGTRVGAPLDEENGVAPLVLGMREMRKLHLFMDYKERLLYVTPGGAGAAALSK